MIVQQEKIYPIKESVLSAVLKYLGQCPYDSVAPLVQSLVISIQQEKAKDKQISDKENSKEQK